MKKKNIMGAPKQIPLEDAIEMPNFTQVSAEDATFRLEHEKNHHYYLYDSHRQMYVYLYSVAKLVGKMVDGEYM